ncbi:heavy-metal-associated domain-containing protein [Stieleria varia]|uniref:Heavy-metal-associated domain protein n=1 Tax=Stieleria varia TaxID=2528005 RepID=A0A5C5ZYD0_9BACT|nr:heavy-metal-associated domain-containing protein [Stieleria varia]TWT91323.1 hypothetical protein Pla52n_66570 [Stieleria varia]
MRSVVYGVAILAAAGIMYVVAQTPSDPATNQETAVATSVTQPATVEPSAEQLTKVTLSVPDMMCPHGCYPSIKERLESSDDIVSVELGPQKVEGEIDNRQIIVTHKESFNVDDAIAQLETIGFKNASVVQ